MGAIGAWELYLEAGGNGELPWPMGSAWDSSGEFEEGTLPAILLSLTFLEPLTPIFFSFAFYFSKFPSLFDFSVLVLHPLMLRGYSYIGAQRSLLVVLRGVCCARD